MGGKWIVKMGFDPLVRERYLWAPRLNTTKKMYGHTINTLIRVLMSFMSLVCLLIGKRIELEKLTLSMTFVQSRISSVQKEYTIIRIGIIESPI